MIFQPFGKLGNNLEITLVNFCRNDFSTGSIAFPNSRHHPPLATIAADSHFRAWATQAYT